MQKSYGDKVPRVARFIGWIVALLALASAFGEGSALASESLVIQTPPAESNYTVGEQRETGAGSEYVMVTVSCEASTTGFHFVTAQFKVAENTTQLAKLTAEGKEHPVSAEFSALLPAKTKWEASLSSECAKKEGFWDHWKVEATTAIAGPKGETGPSGPKGETGPAGVEGKEGGGQLTSFGTPAENTLSELKESGETIGWCIIGAMLAISLGFAIFKVLRADRD